MKCVLLLLCAGGCVVDPADHGDPPISATCIDVSLAVGMVAPVPANTGSVCLHLDGSNAFIPGFGATSDMREGPVSRTALLLTDATGTELARGLDYLAGVNPDRMSNEIRWYLDVPVRDVVLAVDGAHPALTLHLSDEND